MRSLNQDFRTDFPASIGNFATTLSDLTGKTCNAIRLVVGGEVTTRDPVSLYISAAALRDIFYSDWKQSGHSNFYSFCESSNEEDIHKKIKELSLDDSYWRSEHLLELIEAGRGYFNDIEEDCGIGTRLREFAVRVLLLNNLSIVRHLTANIEDIHYQYCIPCWHGSTSYFFAVCDRALTQSEFATFTGFAHRLFGLAWAFDSGKNWKKISRTFEKDERGPIGLAY